jgi:hypothetical protein
MIVVPSWWGSIKRAADHFCACEPPGLIVAFRISHDDRSALTIKVNHHHHYKYDNQMTILRSADVPV